jgi:dimethylamine monooxygenase subunit C
VNKSRPLYAGLQIDANASQHLFALEGEGIRALQEKIPMLDPATLARSDILYVANAASIANPEPLLRKAGVRDCWQTPTIPTLLPRLRAVLAAARMGLHVHAAGTEGFIAQVVQVAMQSGIDPASIHTEHRGSLARRVQCVHCKGIIENVRHSPVRCGHCGLMLLVRDHYSRRIGAFQGVNIDAEAHGTAPTPEELYP